MNKLTIEIEAEDLNDLYAQFSEVVNKVREGYEGGSGTDPISNFRYRYLVEKKGS